MSSAERYYRQLTMAPPAAVYGNRSAVDTVARATGDTRGMFREPSKSYNKAEFSLSSAHVAARPLLHNRQEIMLSQLRAMNPDRAARFELDIKALQLDATIIRGRYGRQGGGGHKSENKSALEPRYENILPTGKGNNMDTEAELHEAHAVNWQKQATYRSPLSRDQFVAD